MLVNTPASVGAVGYATALDPSMTLGPGTWGGSIISENVTAKHLMNVRHYYTDFKVNLHVSLCEPKTYPSEGKRRKWVSIKNLRKYPMPSGSAKIVDKLIELS